MNVRVVTMIDKKYRLMAAGVIKITSVAAAIG